jgi:predicted NodU family carbamoyl transferase
MAFDFSIVCDFPILWGFSTSTFTSALGFRAGRHEGKIVGLAAYGDSSNLRDVLLSRFECAGGDIRIYGGMNYFFTRWLAQHFSKRDVAAAYQHALEAVTQKALAHWLRKTGLKRIAVSGGVHANFKLNQRIREMEGVEEVFVYPNMGDGGCATGAALLALITIRCLVNHWTMYTTDPSTVSMISPQRSKPATFERAELITWKKLPSCLRQIILSLDSMAVWSTARVRLATGRSFIRRTIPK